MTHTRWVVGVGLALILLTMAPALRFPLLAAPEMTKASAQSTPDTAARVQGDLVNLRADASYDMPGMPFYTFVKALKM